MWLPSKLFEVLGRSLPVHGFHEWRRVHKRIAREVLSQAISEARAANDDWMQGAPYIQLKLRQLIDGFLVVSRLKLAAYVLDLGVVAQPVAPVHEVATCKGMDVRDDGYTGFGEFSQGCLEAPAIVDVVKPWSVGEE
ncbi:MAG: hypothetical protein R3B48_13060 [Kofleriaceae bacterium]